MLRTVHSWAASRVIPSGWSATPTRSPSPPGPGTVAPGQPVCSAPAAQPKRRSRPVRTRSGGPGSSQRHASSGLHTAVEERRRSVPPRCATPGSADSLGPEHGWHRRIIFGVWHIRPTRSGLAANDLVDAAWLQTLAVLGVCASTAAAGALCADCGCAVAASARPPGCTWPRTPSGPSRLPPRTAWRDGALYTSFDEGRVPSGGGPSSTASAMTNHDATIRGRAACSCRPVWRSGSRSRTRCRTSAAPAAPHRRAARRGVPRDGNRRAAGRPSRGGVLRTVRPSHRVARSEERRRPCQT
jgi:hypothetical protein